MNKEEAIKIVRSHYPANKQMLNEALEVLIPELKEDENEKIRKEIIAVFKGQIAFTSEEDAKKYIAWLEKQGEQKPADKEYTFKAIPRLLDMIKPTERTKAYCQKLIDTFKKEGYHTDAKIVGECLRQMNGENVAMAVMDEQQSIERKDFISIPFGAYDSELVEESITIPDDCYATIEGNKIQIKKKDKSATEAIKEEKVDNANKVESTFKAGDWVVRTNGKSFCNGNKFAQIESIELDGEMCYLDTGRWLYPSEIRPWTIQDAKDGDVLAVSWWQDKNLWEKLIIFKKFHNGGVEGICNTQCVEGYGNTFKNGKLAINEEVPYYSKTWTCNLHPATKEQRDLLFQKMRENDYKWNPETKELNRDNENKEYNS